MFPTIWTYNRIHHVGAIASASERNRLPRPLRVAVWILVNGFCLLVRFKFPANGPKAVGRSCENEKMIVRKTDSGVVIAGIPFLPCYVGQEVPSSKNLIRHHLEIVRFVVVKRHPERPVLRQQVADHLQPVAHHREPDGMLQPVVIVLEGRAGVVGWVDEDAFHPAGMVGLQRLQRQQVVALDQQVRRSALVAPAVFLDQKPRFQAWTLLLADPGQLQLPLHDLLPVRPAACRAGGRIAVFR